MNIDRDLIDELCECCEHYDNECANGLVQHSCDFLMEAQERRNHLLDNSTITEAETAIQKAVKCFNRVSVEELEKLVTLTSKQIVDSIKVNVKTSLNEIIMQACGEEITRIAQEHMKEVFAEILVSGLVIAPNDRWSNREKQIRDVVREEMERILKKLGDKSTMTAYAKDAIANYVDADLQQIAKKAVSDFRAETLEEFKREGMKAFMKHVSAGIAGDKKLLEMLGTMGKLE